MADRPSTAFVLRSAGAILARVDESGPVLPTGSADEASRPTRFASVGETVRAVRSGDPITIDGKRIQPVLYDVEHRRTIPTGYAWIQPSRLFEGPGDWWQAYRAVAPTVDTIENDSEHGASYLSYRALEVLRDRAAERAHGCAGITELRSVAESLVVCRPSMGVIATRVDRVMAVTDSGQKPVAVEQAAIACLFNALVADQLVATRGSSIVVGHRVMTLSRSDTVSMALDTGGASIVAVLESRPGGEGTSTAQRLATHTDVSLWPDSAVAHVIETTPVDLLIVGADSVLRDGSVVNKVGTRSAAAAAAACDVPVYVLSSRDKVSVTNEPHLEQLEPIWIETDCDPIRFERPLFDHTPATLVTGIVTETGIIDPADIEPIAAEHEVRAHWRS